MKKIIKTVHGYSGASWPPKSGRQTDKEKVGEQKTHLTFRHMLTPLGQNGQNGDKMCSNEAKKHLIQELESGACWPLFAQNPEQADPQVKIGEKNPEHADHFA